MLRGLEYIIPNGPPALTCLESPFLPVSLGTPSGLPGLTGFGSPPPVLTDPGSGAITTCSPVSLLAAVGTAQGLVGNVSF